MSGTHVGILGHVADPGLVLQVELKRVLSEIWSSQAYRPLVLHHGYDHGSDDLAHDHARALGGWRIEGHPAHDGRLPRQRSKGDLDVLHASRRLAERDVEIAEASHILIVIASANESDHPDLWSIVKKARSSGRTIMHIWQSRPKTTFPKPAPRKRIKAAKPTTQELTRIRQLAQRDLTTGRVSHKYRIFCATNRLSDSLASLQLWTEYKSVTQKKPAPPKSVRKPIAKARGKAPAGSVTPPAKPRSRTDPMGAVPLTPHMNDLLHQVNPPDPDVWR